MQVSSKHLGFASKVFGNMLEDLSSLFGNMFEDLSSLFSENSKELRKHLFIGMICTHWKFFSTLSMAKLEVFPERWIYASLPDCFLDSQVRISRSSRGLHRHVDRASSTNATPKT